MSNNSKNEKVSEEEIILKKHKYLLQREERSKKKKYAPRGGTKGAQIEQTRARHFYAGSKKKARVRVIDKTEK